MALLATDINDITLYRMMHLDELVELFQGYIADHPEHTEYYESVIIHLKGIKKIEEAKLVRTEDNTINPDEEEPCQHH